MSTFVHVWALLNPKIEYTNLIGNCKTLWDSLSLEVQRTTYQNIRKKKIENIFVDYNPLLAIRHNIPQTYQQVLSFEAYYARFGTTEPQDGWQQMFLPEQQKTIYVKKQSV